MTAMTLRTDEHAAWLITDGAIFDINDGMVRGLQSKGLILGEMRTVIGLSGRIGVADFIPHLQKAFRTPTQSAMLDAIPVALRACWRGVNKEGGNQWWQAARLYVAMYDLKRLRPRTFVCSTKPFMQASKPFRMTEMEIACPPGATFADGFYPVDDREGAVAMLRAQREYRDPGAPDLPMIGGSCAMYCCTATGVQASTVLDFADQIGRPADVADKGVPIHGEILIAWPEWPPRTPEQRRIEGINMMVLDDA